MLTQYIQKLIIKLASKLEFDVPLDEGSCCFALF